MSRHAGLLRAVAGLPACLLLAACGAVSDSGTPRDKAATRPAAEDRAEPDPNISGRFPLASQLQDSAAVAAGDAGMGYRKGLRLVGQNPILYPGTNVPRGQNFQLGWIGDCAYVGTADLTQYVAHRYYMTPVIATAADPATGIAVIDAADPAQPELVQILPNPDVSTDLEDPGSIPGELSPYIERQQLPNTHRAMAMNWFALASHEGRRVLVAGAHTLMGIFDATDCRNPVLKSTLDLHHDNVAVHGLRLSADGMRVYVSGVLTFDAMAVIDIADLAQPRILMTWPFGAHDLEPNADETRLYMNSLTQPGTAIGGGLRVVDITGIKACGEAMPDHKDGGHEHEPPPGCPETFTEVAHYRWNGLSHANHVGRISGRPYAFTVDEYSSTDAPDQSTPATCQPGWVRIIDLGDETEPQQVAQIKLGVSDWSNCGTITQDTLTYSAHYLELDDTADTKLVFVAWYASGLRVFDVTDPEEPREVAYLMPPPSPQAVFQSAFGKPLADSTISHIRWRPELGHLWVVNVNGGFTILEFTQSAALPDGIAD